MTGHCYFFKFLSVDESVEGKCLMRFHSENAVYNFFWGSVDETLSF